MRGKNETSGREPALSGATCLQATGHALTGREPELSGLRARAESMRRPLILYADDDWDYVTTVSMFLSTFGLRVQGAFNGRSALRLADELRPDLIVTDVVKPDMSGLDMLAHLKANPALRHIPVVVHTAHGDGFWSQQSMNLGAVAFSSKPWELDDLIKTVLEALGLEQMPSDWAGIA